MSVITKTEVDAMAQDKKYVTLDSKNFKTEVVESDLPVLVDFWAAWCGPCRMIAPAIEELAEEFDGMAKIAKLDVDAEPEIAGSLGIQSIPTLLFFRNGEVVDAAVGAVPKQALADKLNALVPAKA
jgi:thioredoxin 1